MDEIGAIDTSSSASSVSDASFAAPSAPSPQVETPAESPVATAPSDSVSRSPEADESEHDDGTDHDVTRGMRDLRNQPDVDGRDAQGSAAQNGSGKPVNDGATQDGAEKPANDGADSDVTRKIATPSKPTAAGASADSSREFATRNSPKVSDEDKSLANTIKGVVDTRQGELPLQMQGDGPYKGWTVDGDKKNWGFQPDQTQLEDGVKQSLEGAKPSADGNGSLTLPNGQNASFQTTRGADGVDQYSVKLPDGRSMNVFMNNAGLDDKGVNTALTNISDTVNRGPSSLYARTTADGLDRQNTVDVYVDKSLGIGGTENGVGAVNGLTDAADNPNSIHVAAPFTQNAENLRGVLDHEAGHLLDARNGNPSQSGVFGRGMAGPASKSFVSDYAASGNKEDFAESNAELMRFRDAYKTSTGRDFLTQPADQQASALSKPWTFNGNGINQQVQYPPIINAKLRQIADIYRRQGN